MTPDQAYFDQPPFRLAAYPRQTLHLSTRRFCSDNRDQLIELLQQLPGPTHRAALNAISQIAQPSRNEENAIKQGFSLC